MDIAWRPASRRRPGDARLGHRTSASTPVGRARERMAPLTRPRVAEASTSTLERTKHLSLHRYREKSPKPWSAAREPVRHLPEPEILPTYLFGRFDRGIYDPVTEIERRPSTPFFAMEPSCNKRPLRRR